MVQPAAAHMSANIVTPTVAPMFTSLIEFLNAFLMSMNIAVPMAAPIVTRSALNKVSIMIAKAAQRLMTERGVMKMRTKVRQTPVRKKPNMTFEAIMMRWRMDVSCCGNWTKNCVSQGPTQQTDNR